MRKCFENHFQFVYYLTCHCHVIVWFEVFLKGIPKTFEQICFKMHVMISVANQKAKEPRAPKGPAATAPTPTAVNADASFFPA